MRSLLLLYFLVTGTITVQAQDVNALLQQAILLENKPDESAAFEKFKEVLRIDPANHVALVHASELCSRIGNRQKDTRVRDRYYEAAVSYATKALKLNPSSDDANVALAIAVGRTVLVKSGKEKISAVKDIKRYAETALKLNPSNFKAWHIIGKWHYEVSNLNMMEKAAVKIFFGGIPESSLASSIAAYEKAKSLKAGFLLNYLELAKAYKRNGEKARAVAHLRHLLPLPLQTEDDARIKAEANQLLRSWN